jgi:hypothetical protein
MKIAKVLFCFLAICFLATATVQAADGKAYAQAGTWYIHDSIVKSITGFQTNQPVYIACGEDENHGGYPGNAWLMDVQLKGVWDQYKLTPPIAGSQYWTIKVPATLKAIETVRFNVAQASIPGQVRWAQIHLFRAELPYTARKDSTGKWHNGIVLATK